MVNTIFCPRYINCTYSVRYYKTHPCHLDESVSRGGRVPAFTQSTIVATMASWVELSDKSARQISKASLLPATDSPIAPKVLLESSLEARGLHHAGNLLIADSFKTLFRRLLAASPVKTRLFSSLLSQLHLYISLKVATESLCSYYLATI